MTDDNPFHRWKAATARQQPLNFEAGQGSATPEPAHPATELVNGIRAAPGFGGVSSRDGYAVRAAEDGKGQEAAEPEAAPAEDVEVVIECAPDPSSAPWWAAKSAALTREGFYPPVPVAIPVAEPLRSASDDADSLGSFIKHGRTGRSGSFVAHLSIECSRPRALLALIGVVVAGIVGMNALASYRAAKVADAQQVARALAVNHSLALLDQPGGAYPRRTIRDWWSVRHRGWQIVRRRHRRRRHAGSVCGHRGRVRPQSHAAADRRAACGRWARPLTP